MMSPKRRETGESTFGGEDYRDKLNFWGGKDKKK